MRQWETQLVNLAKVLDLCNSPKKDEGGRRCCFMGVKQKVKQVFRLSTNGGRLAVIKGQKGVGKSRLIREVLKDCERPVL